MVSESEEWPAFEMYLEDFRILKENFTHSEIIHVSRTENTRADSLARIVRKQPFLSFTWMLSYQFGLQSRYESV